MRQRLILNDDLRDFLGHTLSSPKIEGHTRPPPVVNVGFDRNKCLGIAARILASLLIQITRHRICIDNALAILASHYVVFDVAPINDSKGLDYLYLLVADALSFKGVRRLHRHQA